MKPTNAAKRPATREALASGATQCPACGSSVVTGLPFCPACGNRVTAPHDDESACLNCGTIPAQEAQFCAACGRALEPGAARPGGVSAAVQQRVGTTAQIVVLDESGEAGKRYPLVSEETTIGRESTDIAFAEDPFMSPFHAQVTAEDGEFSVRDLGSHNGTWLFISGPHRLADGDLMLIGSQILLFRRLGYPGPHPPERDATRRMGSLVPSADIATLIQLRSDGSQRDTLHLSPGRNVGIGREQGDWVFPYDPSMSGLHAEVGSEDADFILVDAGSRNGVAVSVRGDVPLRHGSRFLVGNTMLRLETP